MKKLINDKNNIVEEVVQGMIKAFPDKVSRVENEPIIIRKNKKVNERIMKIMAKMVNPNTVTDMALVNARAQMKTQQLLQKVGKGKRKVQVTLSKNVRSYLSTMTKEMKKQIKTQLGNEKQLANLFQFFK